MSDPASPPPLQHRCPACGKDNRCQVAEGASRCWCFDVTISPGALEQLPDEHTGVACLCADCASGVTPSPCIDTCDLDVARDRCRGCLRTLQEIQDWSTYGARERSEVFRRIQARRAAREAQ